MGGVASVTLSGYEAERRYDKRKQVQKRAREPVFTAALELRSRTEWIYHQSIKEAVDCYLDGEPVDAQQLIPGKSMAIAAIPGEGIFDYCSACGGMSGTCPDHRGGHAASTGDQRVSSSPAAASPAYQRSSSTNFGVTASSSPGIASPTLTPSTLQSSNGASGTFTFSSGGTGGSRNKNSGGKSGRRRWRAPRGRGKCRKCQEEGHYARDCPN